LATLKQIDGNRRNARKSTGPRTPEGKDVSRFNAFKHGLHAESLVIPGEDPAELESLALEYFDEYQPLTPTQRHYVRRLILCDWLRLRYLRIQAEVLTHLVNRHEEDWPATHDSDSPVGQQFLTDSRNSDSVVKLFRQVNSVDRCYDRARAALTCAHTNSESPVPPPEELGSFRNLDRALQSMQPVAVPPDDAA
jgi:hypothetical protein